MDLPGDSTADQVNELNRKLGKHQPRAYYDRRRIPPPGGGSQRPLTATEALADYEAAMSSAGDASRSRYELAYGILTWELLKLLEGDGFTEVQRRELVKALTKAAGELS